MACPEKPSDIIQKARRKLTEALLRIEPGLILDAVDAHLLLTQDEYFSLSCMKERHELLQNLIDTVLRKGESAHEGLLDCLENLRHAFPSLRPIAEYLDNDELPISSNTGSSEKEANAEKTPENLDSGTPSGVPQERDMDENPDPSDSSEIRKDVEKPGCSSLEQNVEVQQELEQEQKHPAEGCSSLEQNVEVQQELEQEEKHPAEGCSSLEQNVEVQQELEQEEKHPAEGCSSLEQNVEVQQELEQEEKHPAEGCSSLEQNVEVQQELEQEEKYPAEERRKAFKDVLWKLKLQKKELKKFSLQEVLEISSGSLKECICSTVGDLPWHFLRKVLALNVTARSTSLQKETFNCLGTREEEEENRIDESIFSTVRLDDRVSVNPLDVLCAVLLCSDSFLQQEILSKMSMCQFALPLLLPPLETSQCTLMLWAMRDIVKKWRPHSLADSRGFIEESLVLRSMPTFSFVRMGSLSLSKSKFLNKFLSPSQLHHDFFLHRDTECGNIPRVIAEGLVEIAWYFPAGQKSLDLFPEPIAVANL